MKATFVNFQKSLYELSQSISWADHKRNGYVIRDPANSDELLYLSESEYKKLVRVMMSSETSLDVIATPHDTPVSISRKFPGPSKSSTESPFKWGLRFSRNSILNLLPGWILKESMIEFKRNFKSFLPSYYKHILSWLGTKQNRNNNKLLRKVGEHFDVIHQTRGINQVITRLKVASIATMQYLAGTPMKSTQELGQRIRLINGLPAFLPSNIRYLLRSRNITYIRTITTMLHSYKGMKGKYSKPDLSSITAPRFHLNLDGNRGEMKFLNFLSLVNFQKHLPFEMDMFESWYEVSRQSILFWKDFNPKGIICNFSVDTEEFPMLLTAGVNHRTSFIGAGIDALAHLILGRKNLLLDYIRTVEFEYGPERFNKPHLIENLKHTVETMSHLAEKLVKYWAQPDVNVNLKDRVKTLCLGKLALKYEAAGKIRVFAISDYWTQFICKPIHNSMFEVLRHHPSDATFDQLGAVSRFMKQEHSFIASYDLKSATDFIPQQLYAKVMGPWMGYDTAQAWVNMLVNRDYIFEGKPYRYTRGQPMGTLSSWSGLAVVHHFVVFLAAQRAGLSHFRDYLVLGDDIVIGNEEVARFYTQVCENYGITIGFAKSFSSNNGFFQFASQDILGDINLSPISLKEILSINLRDKTNSYSEGITSLGAKVEFVNRLIGKGFIEGSNPLNFVRAICSVSKWKEISRDLTKGVFPPQLRDFLLMMLSSTSYVKSNMFSVSQLMGIYYSDINSLTKQKSYSLELQESFLSELFSLIDEITKNKLTDLMSKISESSVTNLSGWCIDEHFYSTIVNSERARFFKDLLRLRKSYKEYTEKVGSAISHNSIIRLSEIDSPIIPIEYTCILEINSILAEIESLRLNIDVFNNTIKGLNKGTDRLPPRVRAFLALRNFLDKQGKPTSIVAGML
jgi:hypothetical protein